MVSYRSDRRGWLHCNGSWVNGWWTSENCSKVWGHWAVARGGDDHVTTLGWRTSGVKSWALDIDRTTCGAGETNTDASEVRNTGCGEEGLCISWAYDVKISLVTALCGGGLTPGCASAKSLAMLHCDPDLLLLSCLRSEVTNLATSSSFCAFLRRRRVSICLAKASLALSASLA